MKYRSIFTYRYRSSITGRWVKKAYALKHPKTTEKERA